MARLPRTRKGKTAVDVVAVEQDGLKRVRLSMGEYGTSGHKNTDMPAEEVRDLITLLEYNLAKVQGKVPWDDA